MKWRKQIPIFIISLSLTALTGCSVKAVQEPSVPDTWLQPVEARDWTPQTVGEALEWGLERQRGLEECNANIRALRSVLRGTKRD